MAEQLTSIVKSKMKNAGEDTENVKSPGGDSVMIEVMEAGGDMGKPVSHHRLCMLPSTVSGHQEWKDTPIVHYWGWT